MSSQSNINFDTTCITYSNNTEYRAALRCFFQMNPVLCPTGSLDPDIKGNSEFDVDLDPETKDELLYDNTMTMSGITEIYNLTKNDDLFITLYKQAAGRIFSDDAIMGLTLLFCYDHFWAFVPVLTDHLNGNISTEAVAKYQDLISNV